MEQTGFPFEIKSLNDSGSIEGLLAGFGVDHGGDQLMPGCLSKSLASRSSPLPMLLHHDLHRPIGAWKEWEERSEGLYVKGNMTLGTRDAQEAHALAKDGALTGLSIGYIARQHRMAGKVRQLQEIDLFEGSLVTVPMNGKTRVTSIKSVCSARDIAEILQASGLSNRQARAAAGAAWKAINQSEHDEDAQAELETILRGATDRLRAL